MTKMRPIDKGISPYVKINNYQEAEPFLNDRIGRYCSFCELPIFHVPEVEHREGKKSSFPGTVRECFDKNGDAIRRKGRLI